MIYNYNDVIRKMIANNTLQDIYYFLCNLEHKQKEFIIRFMLLDYYKIYYCFNGTKPELLKQDIDTIIYKIDTNVEYLLNLVNSVDKFNDLSYIQKSILIENISKTKYDKELLFISKFHMLDKLTYKIIDDIEYYKEYYMDYINQNNNSYLKSDYVNKILKNKLIELKNKNLNKYKKYILEMIIVYYKWKKFIINHDGEYLMNKEDFEYLDKIENYEIDNLFNTLDLDYDFFSTVVEEYFFFSTNKLEITEKEVDNYLFNTSSQEFRIKLNLKKCKENK